VSTAEPVIVCQDVTKRYGSRVALDRLTLTVPQGSVYAVLGPNGAGKTTALSLMEGLRYPDAGTVRVLGLDPRRERRALETRIGVQLQATSLLPDLTVAETLEYFRRLYRVRRVQVNEACAAVDLEGMGSRRVGGLSGGQRQRLAIALALLNTPALLFLDEPSTGLDADSREHLWRFIDRWRTPERTIVLTTHYLDEAERLATHLAVLKNGRVQVAGSVEDALRSLPFRVRGVLEGMAGCRDAMANRYPSWQWTVEGPDLVFTGRDEQELPMVLDRAYGVVGRVPRFRLATAGLTDLWQYVVDIDAEDLAHA
jgi:ABC-2 type transport system ATP-binding protein